jgi:hypothetical protein
LKEQKEGIQGKTLKSNALLDGKKETLAYALEIEKKQIR